MDLSTARRIMDPKTRWDELNLDKCKVKTQFSLMDEATNIALRCIDECIERSRNNDEYTDGKRTIHAFKYDGDLCLNSGKYYVPDWMIEAFEKDEIGYFNPNEPTTLYFMQKINVGDYLTKDMQVVPASKFEKKYTKVED